jgi:DMSO/TMAO reductase YedYZ molybdopterin-dependent catalytic subunit
MDLERQRTEADAPVGTTQRGHVVAGAFVGLLSAAVALGVGQLMAGLTGGESSPVIAVGSTAIDRTPAWLKDYAIRTFGARDKFVLLLGICVVLGIVAIVLGIASIRQPRVGVAGLLILGAVGVIASLTRPGAGLADAIPSVAGTAAGLVAFRSLRRGTGLFDPAPAQPSEDDDADIGGAGDDVVDRRRFLWVGFLAAGAAAVTAGAGQYLLRRSAANASRANVRIPGASSPIPSAPAGTDLSVPGLSTFITPNTTFYRVDTTLLTPAVSADDWRLRVHGMVDREITLTYDQLLARPLIERDITLTCVSNPVGGQYVGNARWVGASLKDLLEEAGVQQGATQLVSRSADGFTAGSPTAAIMDGRDAMLAVSMNGEPLPLNHGFPVRMVVPGLYGYVSATKWLVDIELTTFDAFDAYWIKRGWAQQAPIKTESRIDTPRSDASVHAGEVVVAGVAWAQHRGIRNVEVRADGGGWQQAELGAQDTIDTWRQWMFRWNATPGSHTLQVRATDDTGDTQTAALAPPAPNGATGYHTIYVNVA